MHTLANSSKEGFPPFTFLSSLQRFLKPPLSSGVSLAPRFFAPTLLLTFSGTILPIPAVTRASLLACLLTR